MPKEEPTILDVLVRLGPGKVGEIVVDSPALQAAIAEERGEAQPASKLDWLPILIDLGQSTVERLLERSPDAASAIAEGFAAYDRADAAIGELESKGH